MKTLFLVVSLFLIFTAYANAGTDITFAWDQSAGALGYNVYMSNTSTFAKTNPKVCTAVLKPTHTCTAVNVADGLKYFAATAYDAAGNESDFSNSVSYNGDTTPPIKPPSFRITTTTTVTVTVTP